MDEELQYQAALHIYNEVAELLDQSVPQERLQAKKEKCGALMQELTTALLLLFDCKNPKQLASQLSIQPATIGSWIKKEPLLPRQGTLNRIKIKLDEWRSVHTGQVCTSSGSSNAESLKMFKKQYGVYVQEDILNKPLQFRRIWLFSSLWFWDEEDPVLGKETLALLRKGVEFVYVFPAGSEVASAPQFHDGDSTTLPRSGAESSFNSLVQKMLYGKYGDYDINQITGRMIAVRVTHSSHIPLFFDDAIAVVWEFASDSNEPPMKAALSIPLEQRGQKGENRTMIWIDRDSRASAWHKRYCSKIHEALPKREELKGVCPAIVTFDAANPATIDKAHGPNDEEESK